MAESVRGRAALVTGAGRGIGRAIALELAAAGARVGLVARSLNELAETASLVDGAGGAAVVLRTDLGDPGQLRRLPGRAADELGPVDILINNAAVVWPLGASADLDPEEWAAALDINVTALARLSFGLVRSMVQRGWGRIVNVSSGVAANPASMIGANAYATSKAALEAHTINLAAELTGTGVTVNAYRPGTVDTAMQSWIRHQDPDVIGHPLHERFTSFHEEGRLITPEASARALVTRIGSGDSGQIWSVNDQR